MSDEAYEKRIGVVLKRVYLETMDQLIEKGIYHTRQDVIRDSLRRRFEHYGIEPFGESEDVVRTKVYLEALDQLVEKLRSGTR